MKIRPLSPARRGRPARPRLVALVFCLFLIWTSVRLFKWLSKSRPTKPEEPPVITGPGRGPPNWDELRKYERTLPQHNATLPLPEGRHGRYVRFTNQIRFLGWNNHLNELLLNAETAHQSNRAYVFEEFAWDPPDYPWQPAKGRPTTPLNALLSGPLVGGNWELDDPSPRSVTVDYWEAICPVHRRVVIYSSAAKEPVQLSDGADVFRHMVTLIRDIDAACVEVVASKDDRFPQLFDLWLVGSTRSLSLGEIMLKSATSRLFRSSSVVNAAIHRNMHLFLPRGPRQASASSDSFERMMAVHIRRGDFGPACKDRALWASTYYQWNLWPSHPDRFEVPPGCGDGNATDTAKELYRQHCFPSDDEVRATIRYARAQYMAAHPMRALDVLYILTNADADWVRTFTSSLRGDGWGTVVGTPDLALDEEMMEVSFAVDMEIARRSEVFIGNGWSSFTSNIMHGRLVDGRPPLANRFW